MIKKEDLVKENKELKQKVELLSNNIVDIIEKDIKKGHIIEIVSNIIFLIFILVLILNFVAVITEGKKTREIIYSANKCVEINDEIYCNIGEDND